MKIWAVDLLFEELDVVGAYRSKTIRNVEVRVMLSRRMSHDEIIEECKQNLEKRAEIKVTEIRNIHGRMLGIEEPEFEKMAQWDFYVLGKRPNYLERLSN